MHAILLLLVVMHTNCTYFRKVHVYSFGCLDCLDTEERIFFERFLYKINYVL